MTTYIIESHGLYKIGKTDNMEYRLSCYRTHNPKFELIHTIEFDCEMFLHSHFLDKQFKSEWFSLSTDDVNWIVNNHELLSNNTYEILKERKRIQKHIDQEVALEKKRERRRLAREREIMRRQLQDKEQEEWLLRKIKEDPSRFK